MFHHLAHRLTTASIVTLALLFSQWALASYACPGASDPAVMAEMTAAGQPCDGMDAAQPVLCHEQAAAAAQSFEAVELPAPSMPLIVQLVVLPVVLDAASAIGLPTVDAAEARPPPGPLFLSTLRFRV